MVEKLLDLLDSLEAKDNKILDALHALNVQGEGFLMEEAEQVEKMIVHVLGGDPEHYEYIREESVFMDYANKEVSRNELLSTIKHAIENDLRGPVSFS